MTMYVLALLQLQSQNYMNCVLNGFRTIFRSDLSHSSDLALNDFFLFPNIKKCLERNLIQILTLSMKLNAYFEDLEKSYYTYDIKKLKFH